MKHTLRPGLTHTLEVAICDRLTVPAVMPQAASWQAMPRVLATSMLVALMEWCALELLLPHYDDDEQTLGVHIDMSHVAPTPPGMVVSVEATLTAIDGRFYDFLIIARDERELIGEGRHRRASIRRSRFNARLGEKAARIGR